MTRPLFYALSGLARLLAFTLIFSLALPAVADAFLNRGESGRAETGLSGKFVKEKDNSEYIEFMGKNEVIVTERIGTNLGSFFGTYQLNGNDLIIKVTILGTDSVVRATLSNDRASFVTTLDGDKYISVAAIEAARKAEEERRAEAVRKREEAFKAAGFIAMSERLLNWSGAVAFCKQQGGRLPLINGSASLGSVPQGATIDGFGVVGAPWPSGLPDGHYWSGTEDAGRPGRSRVVNAYGGKVRLAGYGPQSSVRRVVCVR